MKKIVSLSAKVVAFALTASVMVGCSMTTQQGTFVKSEVNTPEIQHIKVDQDNTSLGFINIGNVVRTNYRYALATAAQTTLNNGYKYFSILYPDPYVQMLFERKAANVNDAYEMCNTGEDSFQWGWSYRKMMSEQNRCDSIVRAFDTHSVLGGTVRHREVGFTIKMFQETQGDVNSFNAAEVLSSSLLSDLDKGLFVPNTH